MTTAHLNRAMALLVACTLSLIGACSRESNHAWSPENATLVFMSNRDGNAEIYTLSAASSEWVNLTNTQQASENWPEWSPGGRQIAYQSNLHGNLDVWVMNSDGSEQRRLFPESPGTSTSAVWTPDRRRFLLSRKVGDRGGDLFIVDSNGDLIRRLTDDDFYNGSGVFSPDGKHGAFYSERGEESDIVVINADGSGRAPSFLAARTTTRAGRRTANGWCTQQRHPKALTTIWTSTLSKWTEDRCRSGSLAVQAVRLRDVGSQGPNPASVVSA